MFCPHRTSNGRQIADDLNGQGFRVIALVIRKCRGLGRGILALRRHRAPARPSAAARRGQRRVSCRRAPMARKFTPSARTAKLYVPVGAPCNVCAPDPERYAQISRMNADGSGRENRRAWRPQFGGLSPGIRRTGDLWFTDNGRDNLGDDIPPDELNRVTRRARTFDSRIATAGRFPIRNSAARAMQRIRAGPRRPLVLCGAAGHAVLYSSQFPAAYRNQVFIAEHGSWNRSRKIGYRISLVGSTPRARRLSYNRSAEGWLDVRQPESWGRPADVLVAADGSLFVSDDTAGAIYRIRYRGE